MFSKILALFSPKKKETEGEDGEEEDISEKSQSTDAEDGEESEGTPSRFSIEQSLEGIKNWINEHQTLTLAILGCITGVILICSGLFVWHLVDVYNRPTAEQALEAFEYGAYSQAMVRAESVLKYVREDEIEKKSIAHFVIGASLIEQYQNSHVLEKETYFLSAANHLKEAYALGFPAQFRSAGLLAYGKALYYTDNIPQAIPVLIEAEGRPHQDNKTASWLLANAIIQSEDPDFNRALHYCDLFLDDPATTQMEMYRGKLLRSNILVYLGRFNEANRTFDQVPPLDELEAFQEYVCAQLLIEEGRQLRAQIQKVEQNISENLIESVSAHAPDNVNYENDNSSDDELHSNSPIRNHAPIPSDPLHSTVNRNVSNRETVQYPSAPVPSSQISKPRVSQDYRNAQNQTSRRRNPVVFASNLEKASPPILQVRNQLTAPPDAHSAVAANDLSAAKSAQLAELALLKDRMNQKYTEAILRLEMSKNADATEFVYHYKAIFLQGICFEELGRFTQAAEMFQELIRINPDGNESIAAEFSLAEILRQSGQFDLALARYHRCVEKLKRKGYYQNPMFPRKKLVAQVEKTLDEMIYLKNYADAFRFLAVLKEIIPQRTAIRAQAIGYENWAKDLRNQANAAPYEEMQTLLKEAREKFRLAGKAYFDLAQFEYTSPQYPEYVWSCAENYRAGQNYIRALPMYREYLKHEIALRQAETLAIIGKMYFDLDMLDKSIETYDHFLTLYSDHPLVYQVRLIKSYAHLEKHETDKAKMLLLENLSGVLAPNSAEYRDSIYALGKIYYDEKNTPKAIATLEDAVFLHPEASQAAQSYYMIAQSYLAQVEQERQTLISAKLTTVRATASQAMQRARQSALEHFQKAQTLFNERENVIPLVKSERTMQMICYFEIAKQQLNLQRFNDALKSFEAAQNRFQERPETLDALIQTALIYRRLGQNEQAVQTVQKGKVLLQRLTETNAFPPGYRFNEQEWNELLTWAENS